MADCKSELSLQELLFKLEITVEERRKELAKLCMETEVLFKPWPKLPSEKEMKPVEKVAETEDAFTPEEKDGMNLINSLLKRAQKTISVQKKIKEKHESQDVKSNAVIGNDDDDVKEKGEKDNNNKEMNKCNGDVLLAINSKNCEDFIPKTNKSETCVQSQKLISESSRNSKPKTILTQKPTSNVPIQNNLRNASTSKTDSLKSDLNSVSSGSVNSSRSETQSRGSIRSVRPLSSASNRQKKMAVHMSAPFKTDPNIKVPKRPSSSISVVRKDRTIKSKYLNSLKSTSRTNVLNSSTRKPEINQNRSKCNKQPISSTNNNCDTKNKNNVSAQEVIYEDGKEVMSVREDEVNFDINSATSSLGQQHSKLSELGINDLPEKIERLQIQTTDDKEETASPTFKLLTDGPHLEIPVKLKRLLNLNRKLRQNVSKVAVTRKVGPSDREKFFQGIESMFDQTNELGVQYRKILCLNAHNKLLKLLRDLQLETINELSTPYDVLHAKMMVEFILTAYHDYDEETKTVLNDSKHKDSNYKSIHFPNRSSLLLDWLPSTIVTEEYGNPQQIYYRKRKELQNYTTVYFKLQLLQMQKAIIQTVKTDLLPELKLMDPHTSNYISIFRGIYSLLTCHGNHLPAVVKETFSDE